MVADSLPVIGLDSDRADVRLAEVDFGSGRERILTLREIAIDEISNFTEEQKNRMVIAIPDRSVTVKRLTVPESLSVPMEDYSRFELEQSLLDSPDEFYLDYYHVEGDISAFGFALRRTILDDTLRSYGMSNGAASEYAVGCRTRALALALGYLTFCVAEPGRVTGLADLSGDSVSLCLIHDRRLVGVAHLGADSYEPNSYDGRHRLAIELKTVFNFLTDSSRSPEISQPLSHLVLSGPGLNPELENVIAGYFAGGIGRPKINAGFLANPGELVNINSERFLVALGLTVK